MKKFTLSLMLAIFAFVAQAQVTYTIPLSGFANQLLFQTNNALGFTNTYITNSGTGVYTNSYAGYYTTNNCTNVSGVANLTKAKDIAFQASCFGMTSDTTNKLNFVASNSLDNVTWTADPARNFSLTLNGTSLASVLTNFNAMGGIGYEKFSIAFPNGPSANGVSNFVFGYAAKNGL
jgi:hypothetical protein